MPNDKTGKRRDKMVIFGIVKLEKDKIAYSVVSPIQKEAKNMRKRRRDAVASRFRFVFLVRERETSL